MHEVIGQTNLVKTLKHTELPSLTILLGPSGSGRTTISKHIAELKGYTYITIGNKIADIRQLIQDTVALSQPTVYYISNADNMTMQASNAMLKISEEPPKNLHIIIGLTSLENTLPTIISRGKVFRMDNYSITELEEFFAANYTEDTPYIDKMLLCSNTPGDIIAYMEHDFEQCYNFARKVYDNILEVSTGNSFKIGNSLAFKPETKDLIPVDLFFNVFLEVLRNQINTSDIRVIREMIRYTIETRRELHKKGVNKQLAFNLWILNIRRLRG